VVEWGDAWTNGSWCGDLEKDDTEPVIVKSVGWVEATSKDGITLIGRMTVGGTAGVRSFIPKGMIRKIKKVKY
jgi:hypothetical protein